MDASAVTMFYPGCGEAPMIAQCLKACLGPVTDFTAYFRELYGIVMALDIVS